ncbi:copper transporter [Thermaerobacter sp. PB12/4term]|uniref:copper transporter n=1 Tax=Thermaerobacter sp. PB12/4term TaxID=2293838 RepID=UPI000E3290CE|nr:copper transporter [Thermaerobacter sp. PB12/4term]QIA27092.1 copper transporter [Thermaerobacter sp. PB12/4term]
MGRPGPLGLRYHLLTLMAVFLALGVGIFIGAGMLDDRTLLERQQALIRSLEEDFAALRRDTALLRSENRRLSSELARYGQAEQALASLAVEGRLTGRRIALVVLGEAEAPLAQEAAQLLQAAAARPGARLVVDPGLAQLAGSWPEVAAAALGTPGAGRQRLVQGVAGALAEALVQGPKAEPPAGVAGLAAVGGLTWQPAPGDGPARPDGVVIVHAAGHEPEAILGPLLEALQGEGLTVAGLAAPGGQRAAVYAGAGVPLVEAGSAAARVTLILTLAGQQDRLEGLGVGP